MKTYPELVAEGMKRTFFSEGAELNKLMKVAEKEANLSRGYPTDDKIRDFVNTVVKKAKINDSKLYNELDKLGVSMKTRDNIKAVKKNSSELYTVSYEGYEVFLACLMARLDEGDDDWMVIGLDV